MVARAAGPEATAPGDVLVMVHGLVVSGRYLVPTARRLGERIAVLVPDLPGFGGSPRRAGALSLAGMVDALAEWAVARRLPPAVFLGHSFGCHVVARLAAQRPEMVERIVLVGPTGDPEARTILHHGLRLARDMVHEPPGLWAIIARDFLRAGPLRAWRVARAMVRDPLEGSLTEIGAPALVVRGGTDPICPRRWAAQVAARLPRGRMVEVPGAPHALNFGAPDALAAEVWTFVDE
jgi:pimeloyl-ACP methyl ester carboxylesterase